MPTPARYDGLADWYDSFIRSKNVTTVALNSLERLLGSGPGRCLDVGCGTGIAFPTLAVLNWTTVGVDVSADQLAVAQDRAGLVGASLVQADATELPFADGSFDAAVSLLTHTDFDDLSAVFRESSRVVRPGGRLAYVGIHPCFVGPMIERRAEGPYLLHPGYRRSGWWQDPMDGPVRRRVGVNHVPLGQLLNAALDAGFWLERVEEPGEDDYPLLLAFRATRLPDGAASPN